MKMKNGMKNITCALTNACSLRCSLTYFRADFADDAHINDIVSYLPPSEIAFSHEFDQAIVFTETEEADMLRLPQKEC